MVKGFLTKLVLLNNMNSQQNCTAFKRRDRESKKMVTVLFRFEMIWGMLLTYSNLDSLLVPDLFYKLKWKT